MKYVDDVTTDYDLSPIENPDVRITGGTITGSLVTGVGDLNKDHDWLELTPTADEDYDWMVISGGSFTNMVEDRFLADGFVLEGTDGNYGVAEANTVKFEVNVSGATISVTSADDSITQSRGRWVVPPGERSVQGRRQRRRIPDLGQDRHHLG